MMRSSFSMVSRICGGAIGIAHPAPCQVRLAECHPASDQVGSVRPDTISQLSQRKAASLDNLLRAQDPSGWS